MKTIFFYNRLVVYFTRQPNGNVKLRLKRVTERLYFVMIDLTGLYKIVSLTPANVSKR